MMEAGRLRHKITIEQKQITRDAQGGEIVTWITFAAGVWTDAQPLRGREYVTLRAAQADISIRFAMRYLAGVNPAMRVIWGGNPYEIVDVIDVGGRRRELELMCRGEAANV
jgi:SPP1 family predicted phage head-tail adaptor